MGRSRCALKYYARFQQILILAALIFMAILLRNQWAELRAQPWRLQAGWLLLSSGFMLASWALEIKIWQWILGMLGEHLPYWPAVRIWFLSAITRYVPGNVWQPLSMTMRCQKQGVRAEATIASVVLFQVIILMAAGPVAAFYFGWSGNYGLVSGTGASGTGASGALTAWRGWLIMLILLPVVFFLTKPEWFFRLANRGLQKIGRLPLDITLTSPQLIGLLVAAIIHWVLWGCSFAALTFAINDNAVEQLQVLLPHLIASFSIAYTIGFVSFITPSGFGVREGAFIVLLTPLLGSGPATLAALAMRLYATIGELAAALICLLIERIQRTDHP